MYEFLQQLTNGLSIGGIYALMAVGYSLVYSIMNFSNFAHGGVIMIAAYIGYYLLTMVHLSFMVAFFGAAVLAGVLAVLIQRMAYDPLMKRKAPYLYYIISAMAMSIFLENLIVATIGPNFKTYPQIINNRPMHLGHITLGRLDLMTFAITVVCLVVLVLIIGYTKVGKAIRATSFSLKAAALMGVNTRNVILVVFALGGFFAGIAGVMFGMKYTVFPQIGNITIKSFIAAVFGGLGSLPGAVIGSILLGIIETMTSGYLSSQYRDLVSFILLILVLVIRPMGIMGKLVEDKA